MKNKFLLIVVVLSFITQLLIAQNYNIDAVAGTTINDCSLTLYDSGGNGGDYSISEDYTVTICSGTAEGILLDFITFNTESGFDYLYVYDGPNTGSPQVAGSPFNGTTIPGNITSSGTCITIQFTSDGSVVYPGFQINTSCVVLAAPTCSDGIQNQGEAGVDCGGPCPACTFFPIDAGDQTLCSGTFTDPGGVAGQYGNNDLYTATFCSDNGDDIIFTFNFFDSEATLDHLLIYNGPNTGSPLLLDVSGHAVTVPFTVGSSNASDCLTFVWDSDGSITYDGWLATISCGVMPTCSDGIQNQGETGIDCGGPCSPCPVSTCSGTFYDTGGAGGQYANSEDYEVLYCSDNGDDLIFTFNFFDSEAVDHLYIYNGTDATAPLLLDLSGHAVVTPFNVGSTNASDCLFFVWHSDGSIVYDGWEAFISCGIMPTCTDGIQNQGEQGIDCGGPCTPCVTYVDACNGTFYDTGGNGGDYGSSEGYIWTYCPDVPGMIIQMDFTQWDVEPGNNDDQLIVYDGDDITDPQLYFADGLNSGIGMVQASQTNPSGCLTFMWISDNDALVGSGWLAAINCTYPCQLIQLVWDGSTPVDNANFIDICQGDNVTFNAHGSYPENNTSYFQSDAQSTFTWIFGDGTEQSGVGLTTVNHTYPNEGGYNVDLIITDQEGCISTNALDIKVRVSMTPIFAGTNTNDNTLCLGECANLTGVVNPVTFIMPTGQVLADTTFLPDGSGVTYTTDLTFTNFTPGQTLIQPSDLLEICIDIEHSYIGDLIVWIECPDGSTTELFDGNNASPLNQYLGAPLGGASHDLFDNAPLTDPSVNLPGVPWTYCFDMTAGGLITGTATLANVGVPSGSYTPSGTWADLIGCPLNGTWTIHITDDVGQDNGWIYGWGMNFNPAIYPPLWSFTNTYPIESWSGNGVGVGNPTTACPITIGNQDYIYSVTDDFGCTYDTTISIMVTGVTVTTTSADPTCGLCNGTASVTSNTGGTAPYTYLWSNGATTQSLSNLCAGTYDVTVTDNNGCEGYGSETISSPPAMILNLVVTDAACGANNGSIVVNITNGNPNYDIDWTGGSTNNQPSGYTITPLAPGNYNVTVTDGDGCTVTGSVTIIDVGNVTAGFVYNGNQCLTGNSFDFTNTGSTGGAETYDWVFTGGTPGTSTLENPTGITWSAPGTYAVTQTITAGSCTDFITINITVYPEPTGTFNITEPSCSGVCDGQAQTIPANGSAPYSYQWDAAAGGGTNITATGLCDGSYTVTITDANLCTGTAIAILTEPLPIDLTATRTDILCSGECTGIANVIVNSGGTPVFTYNWGAGTTPTNPTTGGLCAGTYTVTVTDANNCTATASVVISEPANPLALIISGNDPLCNGDCNGNATVVASDGTPGYTYLWNDPAPAQTTVTATGLCDGFYTVTVTDNNGCTETANITLTEPTLLTVNVTGSNISCGGACDGTVAANPGGGSPGYTYAWDNGAGTGSSANSLCANTYTVTVTDNNGCTVTGSYTVIVNPAVTASATGNDVSCNGVCDGDATVTPGGGTGAGTYTYLWSDGQTTLTATGLCDGAYTVTVTDGDGCTATANITINENPAVTASVTGNDVSCNGVCDGDATVTPGGGTGAGTYTYLWSNGQTTVTATALCDGAYTVTVTDGDGCTAIANVTINENPLVTASATGNDVSCNGVCDGDATVTPGGGTGAGTYTYLWSNGQTTVTATALCDGAYTVTVTDGDGCTAIANVTINENPLVTASATGNDVSCNGVCDGDATVTPGGGTGAGTYTYLWSDGQTTVTATGLCDGAYTVTVTDGDGCTATANVTINENPAVTASATGNDVSCNGVCDGDATVTPGGGTGAGTYTYLWSDGQTTVTATGLCDGAYTVTVTDGDGCTATANITINENPAVTASATGNDVSCNGVCDGDATVTPGGGTGAGTYSYLWSNGQTTQLASALCAGAYTVTVTDGDGCTATANITINENPTVTASATGNDVSCNGVCDGDATVTPGGGTGAGTYTYLWSDGQTTVTATGLCDGAYTVTVTDGDGCTAIANVTINENPLVTASATGNDVSCNGVCDGDATVTPGGGTGAGTYTYLWSDGQTTVTATGLCDGAYTVTVTDGDGCTATANITINENPAVTASATGNDVSCNGVCDGDATVTPGGGTGAGTYSYLWSDGQTTITATGLCDGAYTVTVTDGDGCTATANITINENPAVTASTTGNDASCNGICDGDATVTPGGGTGAGTYTFQWDDPGFNTTVTINSLCAGTYNVTVTDANGCTATDLFVVNEPAAMVLTPSTIDAVCGTPSGTASVSVSGGTPVYTYDWDPNGFTGDGTDTYSDLPSGNYSVTVTDANLCTEVLSISVNDAGSPVVTISASTNVSCNGVCDGTAEATITLTSTSPYNYVWSNGSSTLGTTNLTDNVSALCAGNITVTVTDALGCNATATINITENPILNATITASTDVSCNGVCDGDATVSVSGGTGAGTYTYLWSNGQTTATATALCAGVHTVTVTDGNGCIAIDNVTINENPAVTASATGNDVSCNAACDGDATVMPGGGTGAGTYTYLWSNGQTTVTATALCAGAYTVTVTDGDGCTATANITINENPVVTASTTGNDVSCNAACDGGATVTPGGGTGAGTYTYLWSDGQTTVTATGLCAAAYTVTVTDGDGCTATANVTINENPAVTASATGNDVSCNGVCDGDATVTPGGGTGAGTYTYLWSDGQTTVTATGLCAAAYTVTVTDGDGCTATANVTINENPAVTASAAGNDVSCNAACDGDATVTPGGGTGAGTYTYLWNDGQTTQLASALCAGAYTVTVTDGDGCTATANITINENPVVTASATGNDVSCNAACDGDATVTPGGGTGAGTYTYLWSDGQTTVTAIALCAGAYTVTVTDGDGCTATANITINENPVVTASATGNDVSCNAACDGDVTVTPGGGTGAGTYTYLWSDGQTTVTANALCAGAFTVTVTDGDGCTATATITINENPVVTAIATGNDVICNGACDGDATVTAGGGTGAGTYTYLWSDGQTTQMASALCAGAYTVTVTDGDGCTATVNVTINEFPAVTATITGFTDVSIAGLCDGDATVLAGGGTGAGTYTYLWDDPGAQSTTTATGLCAGTFTVTVTDANGCTATATITINEPNALIVVSSTINATCYGVCDGSAMVNVLGGVVPYTFIWDDPLTQTDSIATGLCAGSYNVTITDDNGAQNITNVSITEPTLVIADITDSTYVYCNGLCDGNATVTASGGTVLGAYSYLWDDPGAQTTPTASGLCAGTYTVTVTDDNGCTAIATIVITEPTLLLASITANNDALCNGACDGNATVTATDGTPSYTYLWNDTYAQNSLMADSLCAGNYIVTVTDANGCTATAPVTIGEPTLLVAVTSVTDAHCGLPDGDATVSASGGTIVYTYIWDDLLAQTTQMADTLTTGLYSVTVTDGNGCTVVATANVGDLSGVTANIINQNNVSCNGVCDADATVQGNGGNPPYTYLWDDPGTQIDSMATGLCAGTFNVTVTDLNGCFSVASVVITEPIVLTASISSSNNVNCNSGNDGNASVTPSGGTSPYTYLWDGGATPLDSTNTGLIAGTFNVTVTDINGCTATTSIVITEPTPIILTMSGNDENCLQANGWATVSATGGTVATDYTYLWDGGTNPATDSITNLSAGTYNVIVTDDNGCTATDFQIINNILPGTAIISSFTDVSCNGLCDGDATVSIGGGVPPYTYLWDDSGAQTTTTATNLCAGIYNVAVTDSNNCVVSTSVTISEPAVLSNFLTFTNIVCFGDCNGSVTANVSGGTLPYSYQWDDPLLTIDSTVNNLCSGTYNVTITDFNACTLTESVTLADPNQMTISLDSIVSASCGQPDGSIYITIINGNAPFTYSWNAGTYTTEDIIGVLAGSYTVIVTDFRGCTTTETFNVPDATGPTASIINIQNIDCNGNCNGTITADATGGTGIGTYSYKWDDPAVQTTQTATNLCAGTYNVTVTDANGCISTANATVTEPAPLNANYFVNNVSCNGTCDGSASVVVSGGTLPYSYQWNDPLLQTTDSALNLCAGQYDIFVTDSNNCPINNNVTITEPTFISLSTTNIDVSCFGASDGSATVDAIGGTVAVSYIYAWDDPSLQTTETALGLSDGTYCVTVTDDNACTEAICVTITTPTQLTAQITNFADVTCSGYNDGFAQVDVAGGTPGFTFLWSNTDTTQTITNIGGNTYTVIVTDANSCTTLANVVIDEPSQLLLTLNPTNETCYGYCDGFIDAIISGGTAPYNTLWSDLQTTTTAIDLCPNNYSVIITDDNGCTTTANETITGPPLLEVINPIVTDANCGQPNGGATVQINGGTAPTTYEWQDATFNTISNTLEITAVVAGAYSFTVTDFNGCQATLSISISNLTGPNIDSISVSNVDCYGNNNGTATVYASGGDFPYTYLWNPSSQVNQTAINLPGNVTYTINVTDNSGCIASQTVFVSEPQQLISAIVNNIPVSCYGGNDGSTTVQAAGGTNPLSYFWNPSGQITPNATGLSAGSYIVNITDANGCTSMSNTIITEPTQMFVTETITDATCNGSCDGVISLLTSGGTQPPTYNWLAPASGTNSFAANLCANNYTVIVSDANNCTQTLYYTIGEPSPIVITTSSTPVTCNTTNGSVSIDNITGGNGGYTYIWSPGNYTTATVSGLDDGIYTLQVEDSLGCSEIVNVEILNVPPPNQILFYPTDVLCNGGFNGTIETDVSGGNPPYTYLWSNGQTGVIASNLAAGQYNVTVTDTYGCTIDGFSTVYEPDIIEVFLNGPTQTICIGQWANLTASANGGTGSGTYTFFWTDSTLTDSSAFQMVTPGETTTYQVYAVDSNGCMSNTVYLTVNVYPKLKLVISPDAYICAGSSSMLSADASGGSGAPYTFVWNDGSTQQNNDVSPLQTTTYMVSVYDNCTTPFDSASSTVYVTEAPQLLILPIKQNGCVPLTAIFNSSATVNNGTVSYLWDFGDFSSGSNSSSDSITSHTYENPGTYDVTLTLTSNPANCVSVETFPGLIVVNEIPDAMFYSTPEVVSLFDANFGFWDQSTPVTQWQWIFGDGSTASTQNPEHQYTSADTFIVWLYVTTDAGCRDSVYNTVVVREENTFYAPTAFSPGSGFQNNFFYPKGVGISKDDYFLVIYDRWGEIIYSTDIYPGGTDKKSEVSSGWNGRFKNTGDYVKVGTYTWYCKCKTIYDEEREETGAVTIIR